jgi:hypothetical protein
MAIETAPIVVKLISQRSPYDYVQHQAEHVFEMAHWEQTTLLRNAVQQKTRFDTETGNYRNEAMIEAEKALIDQQKREKMKETSVSLKW